MEDTAIPYELPEVENHSFFFIDQRVTTSIEAKLMHGSCIMLSMDMANEWQATHCNLSQQATWR